jgi:hypothetical protein
MIRHSGDLRDFWQRFQRGAEVAVAGLQSEHALGVREAFQRYLRDVLRRPSAIAVVPQEIDAGSRAGLAPSDEHALETTVLATRALRERLGSAYQFFVASAPAAATLSVAGEQRSFLRIWTAVDSPLGVAFAASSSLELHGDWRSQVADSSSARVGGLLREMTGGAATRRSAVRQSTLLALASTFHGRWEPEGVRPL